MNDEISRIRHKLRNSLNNISMNAELVKLLSESTTPPVEVSAALERILSECRDAATYMDSLTDSSNGNQREPS